MHTTGPMTPTDQLSDITCVAFDFGRVVVDWDPRHLFRQVFTDHDEMEHFLAHVLTPDENLRLDLGMPLITQPDAIAQHLYMTFRVGADF